MAVVTYETREIANACLFEIQIGPKLAPRQRGAKDAQSFIKAILMGLTLTFLVAVLLPAVKAFAADGNTSFANRLAELPADQFRK